VASVILVFVASALTMTTYTMAAEWIQLRFAGVSKGIDEGALNRVVPDREFKPPPPVTPPASSTSVVTADDGFIPDGESLSPFDTDHPAVINLDPDLLEAIQHAATDAEADGVEMVINSGWRSERYQQALFDEAVVTYGSEEEARKWVNTPDRSTHVTGEAVDIGYADADYWLIDYGAEYGLCQTYANEIWHFELSVEPGETCPTPLSDATASGQQQPDSLVGTESERDTPGRSRVFSVTLIHPDTELVDSRAVPIASSELPTDEHIETATRVTQHFDRAGQVALAGTFPRSI
jgi:hypothetical protein